MSRTAFPEVTLVRLPAGTLELVRATADHAGTTPAETMRRAILSAVKPTAPQKRPESRTQQ